MFAVTHLKINIPSRSQPFSDCEHIHAELHYTRKCPFIFLLCVGGLSFKNCYKFMTNEVWLSCVLHSDPGCYFLIPSCYFPCYSCYNKTYGFYKEIFVWFSLWFSAAHLSILSHVFTQLQLLLCANVTAKVYFFVWFSFTQPKCQTLSVTFSFECLILNTNLTDFFSFSSSVLKFPMKLVLSCND